MLSPTRIDKGYPMSRITSRARLLPLLLGILFLSTTGCPVPQIDRPDEDELVVIDTDDLTQTDTSRPDDDTLQIEVEEPTVLASVIYGQGGGVMFDFTLKNVDSKVTVDYVSVFAGNYTDSSGADVPKSGSPPAVSSLIHGRTVNQISVPHTEQFACFTAKEDGKVDTSNEKVWTYVDVYMKVKVGMLTLPKRQSYKHRWDDMDTKKPSARHGIQVDPVYNGVDKTGDLENVPASSYPTQPPSGGP